MTVIDLLRRLRLTAVISSAMMLILTLACIAPGPARADETPMLDRTPPLDFLLERAISGNLIAGGIVVVGNRDGIQYITARGKVDQRPESAPIDEKTVFDLASLTKVIATTPAVIKLIDEGKISLKDPVSRWLPEFRGQGITVLHLLTHTSGLADFQLRPWQGLKTAIKKAAKERRGTDAGAPFNYADINFILLAEIVHQVTGKGIDAYCKEEIYTPLGATQTMFLPPRNDTMVIAPTLGYSSGVVQDTNARRLGGVAGHAGLFSSAADLARFARMMLNGGMLDDQRILSERAVAAMTTPYRCSSGRVLRCLGWDMDSPFSSPKGSYFSDASFGHTGYSGSSIWIDPSRNQFVIMLTNRLNYRDVRMFNQLRSSVSTLAAATMLTPMETPLLVAPQVAMLSLDAPEPPRLQLAMASVKGTKISGIKKGKSRHDAKKKGKNHRRRGSGRTHRA